MPHPDMNANGGHPDEGLLHEWLDDQLSPTEAAEMQTHIASCVACGMRVAEVRGLIAASRRILSALDDVPSGVIPAKFDATDRAEAEVVRAGTDKVTSIDIARSVIRFVSPTPTLRWRRLSSIAALLLVALTIARSDFREEAALRSEQFQVPPIASDSGDALTRNAIAPANAAERVADARATAPRAAPLQTEAPRSAALRERATPAADAAVYKIKSVTTSSPEQVPSEKTDARVGAIASAKKSSETFVADASVVAAAPPPSTVANAAASGTVTNAPPANAARPMFAAPVRVGETPKPATTETQALQARVAASSLRQSSSRPPNTDSVAMLQGKADGVRIDATGATARRIFSRPVAVFDSLALSRTVCSPACETSSLHINSLGAMRYVVSTPTGQRATTSALTTTDRARLQAFIVDVFSSSVLQRGHSICSSVSAAGDRKDNSGNAPEVQVVVDFPGTLTLQQAQRCAKTTTELRDIGDRIDAIAGTEGLRLKLPRKELE